MPIAPWTRLGPYEILAPIGADGTGEICKVRDTLLDSIVAVKVSRGQFPERFEREATAVASLNQPHIFMPRDVGPNYPVIVPIRKTGSLLEVLDQRQAELPK